MQASRCKQSGARVALLILPYACTACLWIVIDSIKEACFLMVGGRDDGVTFDTKEQTHLLQQPCNSLLIQSVVAWELVLPDLECNVCVYTQMQVCDDVRWPRALRQRCPQHHRHFACWQGHRIQPGVRPAHHWPPLWGCHWRCSKVWRFSSSFSGCVYVVYTVFTCMCVCFECACLHVYFFHDSWL